jgi:hypothetical protein
MRMGYDLKSSQCVLNFYDFTKYLEHYGFVAIITWWHKDYIKIIQILLMIKRLNHYKNIFWSLVLEDWLVKGTK